MVCRTIIAGGTTMVIACSRGARRSEPCSTPGCGRTYSKLCDFPLVQLEFGKEPKTCDRKLCDRCAVHVGPNRDLCQPHAKLEKEQGNE
jgi:hypothetical protein